MAERQTATNEASRAHEGHSHGHDQHHGHDHGPDGCMIPKFDTRDLLIRDDIMAKAKEIADMIYTSEEVKHYRLAEAQIKGNERVQALIARMKKRQKELVAFQSFQNQKMVDKIEGELVTLQEELDGIPIVDEFQQSQADINYLLQLVMSVIRDTVAQKLDVETDNTEDAPEECSD